MNLDLLFHPRSIAIIGATSQDWGGGGILLKSITDNGFTGKVYPINPREKELRGLTVYPDITQVPGEVDLAIIAIAARSVPAAIRQCQKKGVKFAIIHTTGFGEFSEEGRKLEMEMVKVAQQGGPRIIGTSSMGLYCPTCSLNTVVTYMVLPHEAGGTTLVSQSGWGSETFVRLGIDKGLRFSKAVSIGTQCDLSIEDFLAYLGDDPDTKVIAAYIEGLKKPEEFIRVATQASLKKPVILWKGSRTKTGARAAASHTGSLATNHAVFEAALKQTGVILATSLRELINLTAGFNCPVLPQGNSVGILVNAGGVATSCADVMEPLGLRLANIPAEVQAELKEYLNRISSAIPNVSNPVDLGWLPNWDQAVPYLKCLEIMLPHVDMAVLMTYIPFDDGVMLDGLKKLINRFKKPIVAIPGHIPEEREGVGLFCKYGIPAYPYPEDGIRTLAALWQYAHWRSTQ